MSSLRSASAPRHRFAALLLATALSPLALPLLPDHGGRIGIVSAAARENLKIDRIEIPVKNGAVILSDISATGSTLSRAEFEALLRTDSLNGLVDRLQKLDAEKIAIGSFEWRFKDASQDMVTTYQGLEMTGIRGGMFDFVSMTGGKQVAKILGSDKKIVSNSEGVFGKMTIEKFDATGIARWLTEADPTGKAPMKQLHGRYEIGAMNVKSDDVTVEIGPSYATGFHARLPRQPISGIIALAGEAGANPKDNARNLKFLAATLDAYSSFQFGEGGLGGMKISGKDRKSGQDFTATLGKMTFNGGAKASFVANDFEVKASDGGFRAKKFGMEGDAYAVIITALEKIMGAEAGKGAAPAEVEEVRKLIAEAAKDIAPKDIAFRIEGIDGDFPPAKNAKNKDRVKFSMNAFEARMGGFVGAVPSRLDYSLSALKIPVPADSTDQGIRTLRELGLDVLDLSARIKGTWDEAKTRFVVDDINAELGKFGRVGLKGEFGNIPRTLFEKPQESWMFVLMGGNVQNISLAIDNKGGIEKLIAKAAADQKAPPEQFKMQLSAIAPALIGAYLAGHPDGPALADAITNFIRMPGTLNITARADSPSGISMADFTASGGNPGILLKKVKIEAVAK